MPILSPVTCSSSCTSIYDPTPQPLRGIPLQWYVRPIARQGGVFVDMPKGYRAEGCTVDCCEEPAPPVGP